ncbi:hypothetical protein F2Q69_00051381 [Brassica cretica]|uniref:Vps52 C-terminal domain-containing protein n=1 Tax=Brassica cretica TaxID=69181 RepID=A0A8S9PTZ0_BRACR|nr:hypothetical protein F2Q69_00051381 [Brassica cretica]
MDVRAAYIDTMNKVLSAHFRAYIQALEKLQLDIATAYDLIGVETRSAGLFSRAREPLKNRSAVFALGERIKIIKEIDQPALIPHIAEASALKYPYEVLFRSLHKLLMDTATSEYIFCDDFFGEESIFYEIFAGPFSVIDEHFNPVLTNCFDAIGLMLMIRIIHHHQVLSAHFRAYIQALEKLQLDIATAYDLIGVETRSAGLFSRAREPLKNRSAVFALGERIKIIKEIDQPALIPHIAEASALKYPYEVLFRSLHKLLMDTATSEYIFCDDFFGEESIFYEIFAGPFSVIDEHFNPVLTNCFDAIGLMLMIRIIHHHQVNISLWPRFKMVFDSHISSLRDANIKTLWEDDVHPHYVMRRYAEFTASFIHLNVEYGDGQLDINLERLRMAVDVLILKLAKLFPRPKQQIVFLINNYDMTIAVLKEAGPEGGKIQMHFEELLKSNTSLFVEELLVEHFSDLIRFVKSRASEDSSSNPERSITVAEVDPLVKDFGSRWKTAIELMHKDIITSFSNFLCGMEILRAALTQLLLYYTRLTDCIKKIPGGSGLNKDLVSIQSIMFEIRKYSKTF